MVVNRGFSFSNIVGIYTIQPAADGGEDYIKALYPGSVKPIYSFNSYEEGSVAYEFASIDTGAYEQILQFCSKYGLLYSDRLERNRKNDYIFSKQYKSVFSEEQPDYTCDKLYVSTFIREVITMRHFLGLKAAIDSKNLVEIMLNIAKILLSFNDKTHIPSDTEAEQFNQQFYLFIKRRFRKDPNNFHFQNEDISDVLSAFIKELNDYRKVTSAVEKKFLFDSSEKFENIHHSMWQSICSLFTSLLSVTQILSDEEGQNIHFEGPISEQQLIEAGITLDQATQLGNACISDVMNSQTSNVTPELRCETGKLLADWHITTLLEAMYMELQVTFSPNTMIKKCANPTCNYYFDVGIGNSKKIYCSQRCALLMAKRKQRARNKVKKYND